MLFERISNLFLMIHDFLLLVFGEYSFVYAQDEGRSVELEIIVEFGESAFRRKGLSLIFWAKLHLNVIFGRMRF